MGQSYTSKSVQETEAIAQTFSVTLRRGSVVALYGELGAGKTQFVKGICSAFDVKELVTSPSFVLLNRYNGRDASGDELLVYHWDLYRIRSVDEVYDLGYEEIFRGDGICLIEWADAISELLPEERIDVRMSAGEGETERVIRIESLEPQEVGRERSTSRPAAS
jgi:tRNA threonylcarbamoyladenosine biosynthesis protein TsaE